MAALHAKASYWLRKGIFDDLTSFDDFEVRVSAVPEEKDRGDIFEIFIEGYLATQTITQHVRHWVVGSIPLPFREKYNLPRDATGIDGLYEMHDGSHVAYQVKFRQKEHLTYAEVAPFLGLTERFSDRVIFTNASALSDKAIQRTRWVSREVFAGLSANALRSIEAWLKEKPLPVTRATPDPRHQVQALNDIKATLEKHDRATVVMACGTGKTLVALWAAEQQQPKTVLVLVPSLTLLQQTLREWSEQTNWGQHFRYLCVCSDETVGLKDDSWNTDKAEVGFRIDTDPKVVRAFLESETDEVKVIFSTYHSSPVVGEGAADLPPIDLAIFDEAHKTTGHSGTAFTYALSDEHLPIRKRLFLTATPRHIDIGHRDKEGEFRVQSMDDEKVYGPRAHTLSFAAASKMGIICPFKVVISLIDKEAVTDFARKHGITIVETDEIGARWVANLVALAQSVEHVDASKIITFHSRVRLAQEFASAEPRGIAYYLDGFDVRHVNGAQNSAMRAEIIRAFTDAPRSLLTNARCLTEGIDIPAVDMVAFMDPRRSRIDIAQAVGRAMRQPKGRSTKAFGYVVVPVFAGMGESDSVEKAIVDERFDVVADVVNALQDHDDVLVDIIRDIRERKGAGQPFNPRRLREKLEVIGPRVALTQLTESIGLQVAERIGRAWDESFGHLLRFKEHVGHCVVPKSYSDGTCRLGDWVSRQRDARDEMAAERKTRLDSIGFVWNKHDSMWEENFAALVEFKTLRGHCEVPQSLKVNGLGLGVWANNQRRTKDSIPSDRKARLDAIGFNWTPRAGRWEKGFSVLVAYRDRVGHCRVSSSNLIEGDKSLMSWVQKQRDDWDAMPADRRTRLESIGFERAPFEARWQEAFDALKAFKAENGHLRVPRDHLSGDINLGQWVLVQRTLEDNLPADRKHQLDALGFDWNPFGNRWEQGFAALKAFKAQHGHCRVPSDAKVAGKGLGVWVMSQRRRREKMPATYRQRLEEIGFVWDPDMDHWQQGLVALMSFMKQHGHCRVAHGLNVDGFKLGFWVANCRYRKNEMPIEHRRLLDSMGFDWNPISSKWEEGFAALVTFRAREGHCRVPRGHIEDHVRLGRWVARQREVRDQLSTEVKERLEKLGFVWRVRRGVED